MYVNVKGHLQCHQGKTVYRFQWKCGQLSCRKFQWNESWPSWRKLSTGRTLQWSLCPLDRDPGTSRGREDSRWWRDWEEGQLWCLCLMKLTKALMYLWPSMWHETNDQESCRGGKRRQTNPHIHMKTHLDTWGNLREKKNTKISWVSEVSCEGAFVAAEKRTLYVLHQYTMMMTLLAAWCTQHTNI